MAGKQTIQLRRGGAREAALLFIVWVLLALNSSAAWAGGRVAVLPIEATGISSQTKSGLMATISQAVADSYTLEAVTDDDFATMVDFELRDLAQFCDETDCRMDLARAARVDYILRSKLASFGSGYSLELALISALSGKVMVRQHGLLPRDPMGLMRGVQKSTHSALRKLTSRRTVTRHPNAPSQHVMRRQPVEVPQQTKVITGLLGGVGAVSLAWGVSMHAQGAAEPIADGAEQARMTGGALMGVGSAMLLSALFYYGSALAESVVED